MCLYNLLHVLDKFSLFSIILQSTGIRILSLMGYAVTLASIHYKKSQTPHQIQKKSIILDCAIWSIMCYFFYNYLKSTGSSSFLLLVLIVYYTVKQMNLYETLYIIFFHRDFLCSFFSLK